VFEEKQYGDKLPHHVHQHCSGLGVDISWAQVRYHLLLNQQDHSWII
jgi:hypothetical protein